MLPPVSTRTNGDVSLKSKDSHFKTHLCRLVLKPLLWRLVWFTAISLSPSRLPFYLPKTFMNSNYLWTKDSLSPVLRMASFLESPGCYLSPPQRVAAVVQPCQDQVELERKGKKSWRKQRCLLQWQIPNWSLWSWDSSLRKQRTELQI